MAIAVRAPLAAALVLTGAVGAVTVVSATWPAHPAPVTVTNTASPQPNELRTTTYVTSLLAHTPALPGATRLATSPDSALSGLCAPDGLDNQVTRRVWFRAPGTVNSALAYYRMHRPPGLSDDGGAAGPKVWFVNSSRPASSSFVRPAVQVAIERYGTGVLVGVGARANWVPIRTDDSRVVDPSSVTAWISRAQRHPAVVVRPRTLDADTAATLARIVNRLPATNRPDVFNCPSIAQPLTLTLLFRTPAGTLRLTQPLYCGIGATIVSASGPHYLANGADVVRSVWQALDLPTTSGRR